MNVESTKINIPSPEEVEGLAKEKLKENKLFIKELKRLKNNKIDSLVRDIHYEAFENYDCLDCGNCCKTISPIIRDVDIQRLSKKLKMKPSKFTEEYIEFDKDDYWVFRNQPCPFLLNDNHCMVYDKRPLACSEYPHTDRKNFIAIIDLSLKNAEICPVVYYVFERLKKELNLNVNFKK